MNLKSYFAGTVEAAMRLASQEMGSDAMLVHSKKAGPEAKHLGEYEVVFATGAEAAPAPVSSPPAAAALAEPLRETPGLREEVALIRRQLERMAESVSKSSSLMTGRFLAQPQLASIFAALTEAEVESDLALDITRRLLARRAELERDEESALRSELAGRFHVAGGIGGAGIGEVWSGQKILALAGPSGVGKTTTIAKLAVAYGLRARRPVQLLSMDNYRIAASEQLRSFAAILGVGFQAPETPGALAQAIEECRNKDLILIDTPGYGAGDGANASDLAAFLAAHPQIETHLVLSCSAKPADLSRVVDWFEIFRPSRLLFTRVDETRTFGAILNESARRGLPVSFLCTGPLVPDDLEVASKERVIDLILGNRQGVPGGQAPKPAVGAARAAGWAAAG
jgi:flagellar biosynthesis protein FlhF